jgi:nitrogen PTS system EIIA component
MNIREILKPSCICSNLKATSKEDVIQEMSHLMKGAYPEIDEDVLSAVMMEREKLGSTGIGNGVAILHGKIDHTNDVIVGLGRSVTGIDFGSLDSQPVHLFFILVAPRNSASLHLKAMARLSRMLRNEEFRERLQAAQSEEELNDMIVHEDEKL